MTTLVAPGGVVIYGGVGAFTARSADGSTYVVYCGERPNFKFGTHIYRILPDNRMEWVEYAPFTEGRVIVSVEPDGMYISFPVNRERQPERVKVAGYVTPPFPGGTHTLPPAPVPTQPVPTQPVDMVDEGARQYTTAVKKELIAELDKLKARVAALENSPGGVTEQQVRDVVWSLVPDRVYADLNGYNNPVKNVLETIIRRIIKNG
jgi:hypothetical protein